MRNDNGPRNNFLNRREWGSYVSALQAAAVYPTLKDAVKSGRDWFTESATHASSWLGASAHLKDRFSVG